MDFYQRAAYYAERIERELHGLGAWQAAALPSAAYESQQAFFADTMTFYQWLQFVLLARVRQMVAKRGAFRRRVLWGPTRFGNWTGVTRLAI